MGEKRLEIAHMSEELDMLARDAHALGTNLREKLHSHLSDLSRVCTGHGTQHCPALHTAYSNKILSLMLLISFYNFIPLVYFSVFLSRIYISSSMSILQQ